MSQRTEFKEQSKIINSFVFAFTKFIIVFSEDVLENLKLIQNKSHLKSIDKPPSKEEWINFYKNENNLIEPFFNFLKEDIATEEFPSHGIGSFYNYLILNDKKELNDDEYLKLKQDFYKALKFFTEFLKNATEGHNKEDVHQNDKEKYIFPNNLILFFVAVYLPCNYYYGISPQKLYKEARKGSIEDITKLLRVDPSILSDSLISEHFHIAAMDANRSNFDSIVYSLGHPPKEKITLDKVKFKLAGLISSASAKLKMKFKAVEIEKVFDALGEELNREELILVKVDDPDKTPYNKTITQKVRREKQFWEQSE